MNDITEIIVSFVVAGIVFGLIDAVWLSLVANKFYKSQIGGLLLKKPNMIPAVAFYVIYLIGLLVFVSHPALTESSLQMAIGLGALFGFVCYSTYDLTNLATLKGFTYKLVIVDLVWGTAVTTLVSAITYLVVTGLLR